MNLFFTVLSFGMSHFFGAIPYELTSLLDLRNFQIEVVESGGYVSPSDGNGCSCIIQHVLNVNPNSVSRAMRCSEQSTLYPGTILHKSVLPMRIDTIVAFLSPCLELIASRETAPVNSSSLTADDWTVSLTVAANGNSYAVSVLRHDLQIGRGLGEALDALDRFSSEMLPFSSATLQEGFK